MWCTVASVWIVWQDELLAELEDLEQEELDRELLQVGGENLPSIPTAPLPSSKGIFLQCYMCTKVFLLLCFLKLNVFFFSTHTQISLLVTLTGISAADHCWQVPLWGFLFLFQIEMLKKEYGDQNGKARH